MFIKISLSVVAVRYTGDKFGRRFSGIRMALSDEAKRTMYIQLKFLTILVPINLMA